MADGIDDAAATQGVPVKQELSAQIINSGSGAIASNGGVSAGEGGIAVGGDVHGGIHQTINQGDLAYDVRGLPNPYLGLRSFRYEDQALFAGREAVIQAAVERLVEPGEQRTLLFITGASGSGKSSLAMAGLVPALKTYYEDGRHMLTRRATGHPGRQPLAALADALRQLGFTASDLTVNPQAAIGTPDAFAHLVQENTTPEQVNVVVIDQFEELFTQSNTAQQALICAILTGLPAFSELRTHLIATLRADYLPELFVLRPLYDIAKQGIDLRAMSVSELKEAIERPLQVRAAQDSRYQDKRWEPALVDRLANDAAQNAAYLPLLQVTLETLWDRGSLKMSAYGSLTDAIKDRAEAVYAYVDYAESRQHPRTPEDQAIIMDLLLALVNVSLDDETRRDVRRRRRRTDLEANDPTRASLIDDLINARLLSVSVETEGQAQTEYVDIIHESLIRNWDRLQRSIAEKRQRLQQRARFEQALQEWRANGQTDEYLLQGVHLAEARELNEQRDIALRDADAQELLSRSVARQEAQLHHERAQARRLRWLNRVLAIALLIVVGVAGFAWTQRHQAQINAQQAQTNADEAHKQATVALAGQMAAESVNHLGNQLDLALLLAVQATGTSTTVQATSSLLDGLEANPHLVAFIHGSETRPAKINSVALSPDGTLLAGGTDNGMLLLWDLAHPSHRWSLSGSSSTGINSVAFGRYGGRTWLAAGTMDNVVLWDLTGSQHPMGHPLDGSTDQTVNSVAFSKDGRWLAAGTRDGTILLWNMTEQPPVRVALSSSAGPSAVNSIAVSADGRYVATATNSTVQLWTVDARRLTRAGGPIRSPRPDTRFTSVAFSDDHAWLAAGTDDGAILLRHLTAQPPVNLPLKDPAGHAGGIDDVAFSPNGTLVASATRGGAVVLWDLSSRVPVAQFVGATSGVTATSVAFNQNGTLLAAGTSNNTITLWDPVQQPCNALWWEPTHPLACNHALPDSAIALRAVALSPDHALVAAGGDQGILMWSLPGRNRRTDPVLAGAMGQMTSLALGQDGRRLWLAAGEAGTSGALLWDLSARQRLIGPTAIDLGDLVTGVALGTDSHRRLWLATSGGRGVFLSELTGHQPPFRSIAITNDNQVNSVALGQDGQRLWLATGGSDGVRLWNLSSQHHDSILLPGLPQETVWSVAFSADGTKLAAGYDNGDVLLWKVATGQSLGPPLAYGASAVHSVAFGNGDRWLAAGGQDSTIRLWDVATRQPIGSPLSGGGGVINGVAFSQDGAFMASANADSTVMVWNMALSAWQQRACAIANRTLTAQEWQSEDIPPKQQASVCQSRTG